MRYDLLSLPITASLPYKQIKQTVSNQKRFTERTSDCRAVMPFGVTVNTGTSGRYFDTKRAGRPESVSAITNATSRSSEILTANHATAENAQQTKSVSQGGGEWHGISTRQSNKRE